MEYILKPLYGTSKRVFSLATIHTLSLLLSWTFPPPVDFYVRQSTALIERLWDVKNPLPSTTDGGKYRTRITPKDSHDVKTRPPLHSQCSNQYHFIYITWSFWQLQLQLLPSLSLKSVTTNSSKEHGASSVFYQTALICPNILWQKKQENDPPGGNESRKNDLGARSLPFSCFRRMFDKSRLDSWWWFGIFVHGSNYMCTGAFPMIVKSVPVGTENMW